jgi:hypothetical protein
MLPNLPEIQLNPNKSPQIVDQKTLPPLPEYKKEGKIIIGESKEDLYNDHLSTMEKSSLAESNLLPPPKKIPSTDSPSEKNYIKKNEEIFVRIKKFETAISSFNEINSKIVEMQRDIEKSKKLIQDETRELEEWEKELSKMKKGLDAIDRNLFTEIEK